MEVESREAGEGEGTIWNISFLKAWDIYCCQPDMGFVYGSSEPGAVQCSVSAVQCNAVQSKLFSSLFWLLLEY